MPRNYRFETVFEVFLFYLEESRSRPWVAQAYSEAERSAYLKEEIDKIYRNMDKGRRRQIEYIGSVEKMETPRGARLEMSEVICERVVEEVEVVE